MPLGNGDIGLNVWARADGTLHLLISKTDAWDDNSRLVKVGKVVVRFDPNPFAGDFRQELDLATGSISLQRKIRVWVDAHHPVIHITTELPASASIELWRTNRWELTRLEVSDILLNRKKPQQKEAPTFVEPDTLLNATTWYHYNTRSVGPGITARIQGLDGFRQPDPIRHRIFGGKVVKTSSGFDIFVLTQHPSTPQRWLASMDALIRRTGPPDFEAHKRWWTEFWDRSWIHAKTNTNAPSVALQPASVNHQLQRVGQDPLGRNRFATALSDEAAYVSQMYALQRFINACAGRGAHPIKFNGSLFTVPHEGDPDYRRWGPGYWWQNTRLPYLSMCASGDFDLMKPLFRMYAEQLLPLCKYRTKLYCGHEGAFYPECMYFWGAIFSDTYGWTPFEQREDKLQESRYHKWEWVGGLELCWLLLDYYEHTLDRVFLQKTVLPFCREILTFFDQHYKNGPDGKLILQPAQALETWWECTNPMPELAGCIAVSERLMTLTADPFYRRFRARLPPLPLRDINGKKALAPAEKFDIKRNSENPELYAVFPFRLIAVGKPNIEWGLEALRHRWNKGDFGW